MRILQLIPTLGGGGAERQLALLAPAIAEQGLEIAVAYHGEGPNLPLLVGSKVEVIQLPGRNNHHPAQLLDIYKLIKSWKPDVVQTWLPQMDILGGIVARLSGLPHIISERSSAQMYGTGWKITLRVRLGKSARAIVANSRGGIDYWQSLGAKGQLTVIPNAMNPKAANIPDHPWEGRRYLVTAGRLSHEKNALTAVKALIRALEITPDIHAAIVGDGPDREAVAAIIAASSSADRIRLVGYSTQLPAWLHHAEAYLSASYVEGHPNVVIEAAQARCPLILSDIPAHREAVGDDGATFVAEDDIDGFAHALCIAQSEHGQDRIEKAAKKADELALDNISARYVHFYRNLFERVAP